jgi:hypothetical protein
MEKDDFGRDSISSHDDLIDIVRPFHWGRIVEIAILVQVRVLGAQVRRRVDCRFGIGLVPLGDE